jgi:hypothetical protein
MVCTPKWLRIVNRRESVYRSIVRARAMLDAYDALLGRYIKSAKTDAHYSRLNCDRAEILGAALEANYLAGPQAYPVDNRKLSNVVDAIADLDLDHLEFPARLEELVECGILPHLPASPYSTGEYLGKLPPTAQPGDIFYMPIPTYKMCLLPEPGHNEGELLLIFDKAYECNDVLLDADGLAKGMYGDYTKYLKAEQYHNICYILGNDRDEAEKDKIKDRSLLAPNRD